MNKISKYIIVIVLILVIATTAFYHLWLKDKYVVPILMYHSLSEAGEGSTYVKPESFLRQMGYIKRQGYNVISLGELIRGIESYKLFPRNTVVITFDDGYKDSYTEGYRILKTFNFPATIFLLSAYIGFKDEYLTWHHVKEMADSNLITIGSHTKHHAYLPDLLTEASLIDEIIGSKKDIENKLGIKINHFCYPAGGFTKDAKEIVENAGYRSACTTNRGFDKSNKDLFELNRIKIKNSDFIENPLSFWAKLSGYYNLFRKGKNPY